MKTDYQTLIIIVQMSSKIFGAKFQNSIMYVGKAQNTCKIDPFERQVQSYCHIVIQPLLKCLSSKEESRQ